MYHEFYNKLKAKSHRWQNEEEVRQAWVIELNAALGLDLEAERDKKDLSYNNVVIEFKDKGLFHNKTSSPAFKVAIYERLLPYIQRTAQKEHVDESDYIGIAIDGDTICFAQVIDGAIEHGHLLPFSETSFAMVAIALKDNFRRALIAENLISDFGHQSDCGIRMMRCMAKGLASCLNDPGTNKAKMLFQEWRNLFGQVADLSGEQIASITKTLQFSVNTTAALKIPAALFVIHSYNSFIIKLLAAEIISTHKLTSYLNFAQNLSVLPPDSIIDTLRSDIENGQFFSQAGINGFVEEALFSWYLDSYDQREIDGELIGAIRNILVKLSFFRTDNLTSARSKDLLKLFYQNLVPETLRKSLGEFYTPDWLAEFTINKVSGIDWLNQRTLDPTCGSGSFLLEAIKRKTAAAKKAGWKDKEIINLITTSVWGFDLNPLAVQTARVNFLIAIAELLKNVPGKQIEVPILLADAIYSPARNPGKNEAVVTYKIGSEIANLEISLPAALVKDRKRLDEVFKTFGQGIEDGEDYKKVSQRLIQGKTLRQAEALGWETSLKASYNRVLDLHKKNWNGIWFRIIRNFFWSSTAGKFDLVAGNPPWVRWSKLPELYRDRVKPTCQQYDIFSSTPHHGGNELDISAIVTYTVADKWLVENGCMAFIITQTHFQAPSSEGFRSFRINSSAYINPKSVDDMKGLRPFPDAMNKTAVTIFKKEIGKPPKYPVKYTVWSNKEGNPKVIPVNSSLRNFLDKTAHKEMEAHPVTHDRSPWAILNKGRYAKVKELAGKCEWVQGRKGITADLNGIYFVEVLDRNAKEGLVKIRTRPEAGKTDIGPAQDFWIEGDLLYPLIKGASDFSKCYFDRAQSLFAIVPNKKITKDGYSKAEEALAELPQTNTYFTKYKRYLKQRSTFTGRMKHAPFYAIYNVGLYTFAPWKVIWAEQKDFCAAVVSSASVPHQGRRCFVPDHKIFFVDFAEPAPAYFLCGLLNSDLVIEFVKSHTISIQTGDIFKHMTLPPFDKANRRHLRLATLAEKCHGEKLLARRTVLLQKISSLAELILEV